MSYEVSILDSVIVQISLSTFFGAYASWWTARYFVRKRFKRNDEFFVGSQIIRIDADGKELMGKSFIETIDWERLRVSVVSQNRDERITVPFIRFAQYRVVWRA